MFNEKEWNALLAEIDQQEEELQQMRAGFGWELEQRQDPGEAGTASDPSGRTTGRSGPEADETAETGFFNAGTGIFDTGSGANRGATGIFDTGAGENRGRTGVFDTGAGAGRAGLFESRPLSKGSGFPGYSSGGGGSDASSLILEEIHAPVTEEDVQMYQLRKKYSSISGDGNLDRMEREIPAPLREQKEDSPSTSLTAAQLYLRIGGHLMKGQLSDSALQDMVLLAGTDRGADEGMKQFYTAFTLLQGSPSRGRIRDFLEEAEKIPYRNETDGGVRILAQTIRRAAEEQDAENAARDRKYQERQSRYDRERAKAQKEHDAAKRKADRWRK
ncbi:MAG: hypothetical protein Q4D81_04425 [Eubacteriales bacterium]|nr:hypothetical protein [Eubacteriales bacterium]